MYLISIPWMFRVLALCYILTEHVLSIQGLFTNLYVYVFLDPQLDEVAIWIPYLIICAALLLNKQMWF